MSFSHSQRIVLAKKKCAMTTTSQATRKASITVETADGIDMMDTEDTEENIHARGTFFPISNIVNFFELVSGKKGSTLGNLQVTDSNGLLVDMDVQPVNNNPSTHEDQ